MKPTDATPESFINAIEDDSRRADTWALVELLRSVSGEEPRMWGTSIVGFGSRRYRHDSGREGDMPLISFSPRKNALVLYGMADFVGSDALLSNLGKHTTGKGCIYIKKLADVDKEVLRQLTIASLKL